MSTITDRAAQVLAEIDAALELAEKAHGDVPPDYTYCTGLADYYEAATAESGWPLSLQIIRDDIKAWLELRDSLQVGRDNVRTWDFCNRRLTAILDAWEDR